MENLLTSPVTLSLLAANIVASLIGFSSRDFLEQNIFWIGPLLRKQEWHRIVTAGFLHGGQLHLFMNMLTLYFCGPSLEGALGPARFLLLYFGSLLGGTLWEFVEKRRDPNYRSLGASGAISGLLLAISVLAPFSVISLFFFLPMWSIVFGVLFIVISYVLSKRDNTIIAHGGHLGGAVAGLILTLLLVPGAGTNLIREVAEKFG